MSNAETVTGIFISSASDDLERHRKAGPIGFFKSYGHRQGHWLFQKLQATRFPQQCFNLCLMTAEA